MNCALHSCVLKVVQIVLFDKYSHFKINKFWKTSIFFFLKLFKYTAFLRRKLPSKVFLKYSRTILFMKLSFVKGKKISVKDSSNTLNPSTLTLCTEAGYVYLTTTRNKKTGWHVHSFPQKGFINWSFSIKITVDNNWCTQHIFK